MNLFDEILGIPVPESLKGVPMTISKILQFMYNQAEVKDQKLQVLKEFIASHTKVPVELTIRILVCFFLFSLFFIF